MELYRLLMSLAGRWKRLVVLKAEQRVIGEADSTRTEVREYAACCGHYVLLIESQ